jgi:hypothetical protein
LGLQLSITRWPNYAEQRNKRAALVLRQPLRTVRALRHCRQMLL